MPDFSIVCPIHHEVDLIPLTLPSFYPTGASEVLLCLDKPAPENMIKTINKVTKYFGVEDITKIVEVEHTSEFKFHQANVRRTGFLKAKNDVILTTDIDLILDPKIKDYLYLIEQDYGLVSFNKIGYPLTLRSAVANIIQKIYKHQSFTGLYAFSKKAWLETEDFEHLKTQITRAEDTHLHHYLTKKYQYKFISGLKNYCLQPKESKKYQIMQGVNRWVIRKLPLWRVLMSVILYFRPYLLVGYLQARYGVLEGKVVG